MHNLAFIDFETTGLDRNNDEIIEIGIVLVDAQTFNITEKYQTLVKPKHSSANGATHIHGIDDSMLTDAPKFEEIAPTIIQLLNGRSIVGHNVIKFDLQYLNNALAPFNTSISESDCIDTLNIAREFLPAGSKKLVDLARLYSIPLSNAHSALADTEATVGLLYKLLENPAVKQKINSVTAFKTHLFAIKDISNWKSREHFINSPASPIANSNSGLTQNNMNSNITYVNKEGIHVNMHPLMPVLMKEQSTLLPYTLVAIVVFFISLFSGWVLVGLIVGLVILISGINHASNTAKKMLKAYTPEVPFQEYSATRKQLLPEYKLLKKNKLI